MTYRGEVRGGVIVLESEARLAEGTIVRVEAVSPAPDPTAGAEDLDPLFRMGELAVETGITDLAAEADHYLYGHPKANDAH
jgi:predicted ATP-grasp superfamily ATP-dependent carboligase